MLTRKLALFIFTFLIISSVKLFSGISPVYTITYAPSNPVVGQPVTFTLIGSDICAEESLVPDAENNVGNLIAFPGGMPNTIMYTYPAPGAYHVGLDLDYSECLRDQINKTNRDLTPNFMMGPVGGPYTPAVMQGQIFCSPLTIAAAPAPIPTMGQWGLIVLALIFTIMGVVFGFSHSQKAQ